MVTEHLIGSQHVISKPHNAQKFARATPQSKRKSTHIREREREEKKLSYSNQSASLTPCEPLAIRLKIAALAKATRPLFMSTTLTKHNVVNLLKHPLLEIQGGQS